MFIVDENGYSHLKVDDIEETIANNVDVKQFAQKYADAFGDFDKFLDETLIKPMLSLNPQQTRNDISNELFDRIDKLPLIDRYQAFQFFSQDWLLIDTDLEILQTEGFEVVRQIDPHMVIKNNQEVQDGWEGHVLPFGLVQRELLPELLDEITKKENRLAEIAEQYSQIIESMTPEQRDKAILNNDNTKFVAAEVAKELRRITNAITCREIELLQSYPSKKKEKLQFIEEHPELDWHLIETDNTGTYPKGQINKLIAHYQSQFVFEEDSLEYKVQQVSILMAEEKVINEELKSLYKHLDAETIAKIHDINDSTAIELLRIKWIVPLLASLNRMPGEVTTELADKSKHLVAKYATTYQDIANRVAKAETRLHSLIGELQGSAADNLGIEAFRQTLNVI